MPRSSRPVHKNGNRFPMSSVVTLALWRWRQTWFLLLITTIGMIAAVLIVCAVPLFSEIMNTAGLRNTLRANPDSAEIELDAGTAAMSTSVLDNVQNQFGTLLKQNLGSLVQPTQLSILTTDFTLSQPTRNPTSLVLYGASMQQAVPHLGRVQGNVAQPASNSGNDIEVMMTPDTAQRMGVKIGGTIKLQVKYYLAMPSARGEKPPPAQKTLNLTAHVVGLFNIDPVNAAYWHGDDFKSFAYRQDKITQYTFTMLLPNESLLSIFNRAQTQYRAEAAFSTIFGYTIRQYYQLDAGRVPMSNLNTLIGQIGTLQDAYNASYGDLDQGEINAQPTFPYLNRVSLSSPLFNRGDTPSNLQRFVSRTDVARIPVTVLALQIVLLILFFVSLITNLLVDRQADTIAVLRSRGASSGQIFGAMLTQCVVLSVVAFLSGLPLAVITVSLLSLRILPASGRDALNVITNNPLQATLGVAWYAVAIVLVALLTMSVSLFFAARMDVLAVRREAARTKKRPLWQRLNLDVIAGIIALVGYGLSLYLGSIGDVLQGDAKTLIATPLSIIAPFFLIIGSMFLFLRIFPLLLRLAAWLATRGRGAVSMLALAQIARSPRLSIRMTMLLALSTAFALFTLVYTGTQAQHIQDLTTYQVGADFSGELNAPGRKLNPATVTNQYRAIPGVLSASVGYVGRGNGGTAALPMEIRAVDASTFGRTAIWPSPDVSRNAASLLAQLVAKRRSSVGYDVVPAIVDTTTMNKLRLRVGSPFTVRVDNMNVREMRSFVVGTVPHIPTINDRTTQQGDKGFSVIGGVLVDFQTYAAVYAKDAKRSNNPFAMDDGPIVNHVWLQTKSDAASLSSIRTALKKPGLRVDNLADRQALLASLSTDPLYLALSGILSIGTVTALFLALLGDLLTSWLSARTRLTGFAILRAIGATPQQVASMLTWEQAIIYITGLIVGVGFGALLSFSVIPALTFTNLNAEDLSSNQFYALQSALPTQIVIPSSLPLALFVLIAIYAIALTMMVRVVSKPSLGQVLRLNED